MHPSATIDLKPYLLNRLGKSKLQGTDTPEWRTDCPACGDTGKWNLWFNIQKNKGLCYKCHTSFQPISLVQALEDCSFLAAAKIVRELTSPSYFSVEGLRRRVRQALDERSSPEQAPVTLDKIELPEGFQAASDTSPSKWPKYLMKRIGSEKTVRRLGIGWCESGYYRGRMVVPIELDRKLVSFVARSMFKPCHHCGGDGCGRCDYVKYKAYLYPRGCKTGHVLYNYDVARHYEHVVLVEGVFDAIRVGKRGMAVLGSNLADQQLALLLASAATEVTLIFDPDEAGRKATETTLKKLKPFYSKLRVVTMPGGHDPDFFDYETLWGLINSAPLEGTSSAFALRVKSALTLTHS